MLLFTVLAAAGLLPAAEPDWKSQGVLHVDASPHVRLHSVPVSAVRLGDGLWADRLRATVDHSIPSLLELLEKNGIVDNFRRLSGRTQAPRRGPLYTDSDLYKWMEAAAFVLQSGDRPELRATLDRLTDEIIAAQEPSGYLNTYYVEDRVRLRFSEQQRGHELYCLGHLLQAGIAYYRATGNRKLLDAGIRFTDYLIEISGPQKQPLLTGHPELELALVELYRTTGARRYLDFAGYLLSGVERERLKLSEADIRYMFSGKPFTSRDRLEGHAVRAMYAASGAADYYAETGDAAYWKTLETLWRDLVGSKMYVTGGIGSRAQGEAFGEPYELPNMSAYAESCAAIGSFFWNHRMLAITGEARFAEVMERALYNGINSGMSLSGTLYCYRNPLASTGEKIRNPWYTTTCCPPNLQRVFASLPGYLYSTTQHGLYVNFYHSSEMDWKLQNGTPLRLLQKTGYPFESRVAIELQPAQPAQFTLYLRVPAWSRSTQVKVNGANWPATVSAGQYLALSRRWNPGDSVELNLDLTPRLTAANTRVYENTGKLAVERGPLVYCLEQHDQPRGVSVFDAVLAASRTPARAFSAEFRPDLLGGLWVLRHQGLARSSAGSGQPLYADFSGAVSAPARPAQLTLIPYYAWANREPTAMTVWIPYASR